jgi:DNA-binding transcriptional MerR regulator
VQVSPIRPFHKYRGLGNLTLRSLLEAVRELLPRMVGRQVRYRVTDLPTERTLRYYISQGLVDRPSGQRGTAALYGYRHLLQVLTVKYLQSQYLPLRKIKGLLRGRSNRALEQILPENRAHRASLDTVLKKADGAAVDAGTGQAVTPRVRSRRPAAAAGGAEQRWRHVAVTPGLELHLREDLGPPRDRDELRRWEEELLRSLAALWPEIGEGRERD